MNQVSHPTSTPLTTTGSFNFQFPAFVPRFPQDGVLWGCLSRDMNADFWRLEIMGILF